MKIKRIKLNKNFGLTFTRCGLIDGGKGYKFINISLQKILKNHNETLLSFNIKDFNLIKFKNPIINKNFT